MAERLQATTDMVRLLEESEGICFDRAMSQWRASLKRPDLDEENRVKGALMAYQRQAFACLALPETGARAAQNSPTSEALRESLAQCADDLRKRPAELRGPYGVATPSTESN